MKILVAGSSGLVGTALVERLKKEGHQPIRLIRSEVKNPEEERRWNPSEGELDEEILEGVDGVVNLCGAGIADKRWSEKRREVILDSRVDTSALLARTMVEMDSPPPVWVNASAVGYYGNRGDEELTEESSLGEDYYLAEVCQKWEEAVEPAEEVDIRVVRLRIGVVLDRSGGALQKMYLPFWFGVGGRLGSGKQYMSWIALDDLVSLIIYCLNEDKLSGPVNGTAPHPATNYEFTKTLGKVMKRPTIFPVPAFAVKLLFGQMGEELLLSGAKVLPKKALDAGFTHDYSELDKALRHALGRD